MQKLTLDDFTLATDKWFHYGDYKLRPDFGGFEIFYKNQPTDRKMHDTNETLEIINDHTQGRKILTEDDMRFDAQTDKDYQLSEEE
jgi:hypothetical protein